MALSEFHFLLLLENKVKVVNRISEHTIEELQFDQTSDSASKDVLDETTTMKLLESYGRVEEMVYFASLKGQWRL